MGSGQMERARISRTFYRFYTEFSLFGECVVVRCIPLAYGRDWKREIFLTWKRWRRINIRGSIVRENVRPSRNLSLAVFGVEEKKKERCAKFQILASFFAKSVCVWSCFLFLAMLFVSLDIGCGAKKDGSDEKKSICGKEEKIIFLLLFLLLSVLCFENSKLEKDDLSKKSKFECKTESSRHFGERLSVPIFPFPPFPKQYDVSQSFFLFPQKNRRRWRKRRRRRKIWIVETGRPIAF